MSGDQIFWICITGITGVTLIGAIPLIGLFWRSIVRDITLTKLKVEMVQRGYKADEIERVVQAAPSNPAAAVLASSSSLAAAQMQE